MFQGRAKDHSGTRTACQGRRGRTFPHCKSACDVRVADDGEHSMTEAGQNPTILIRGGRIYDHDGDVHQPSTGDLLVSAGRIERIAPRIDPPAGAEIIDASNKLVAPGLVNAHYHSH